MNQPYQILSSSDLEAIHQTSLKILEHTGIRFSHPDALQLFKKRGMTIDGEVVKFPARVVEESIAQAPESFTIQARNPDRSVVVGEQGIVLVPGYGAPFLIDFEHGKRVPDLTDYQNLIKLNQLLPHQDMTGYLLVEPQDLESETAHLDMLQAALLLTDKPYLGSAVSQQAAEDTIALSKILFGGSLDQPVTIGVISALSPLAYSPDMIAAVTTFAEANQPLLFANLVMAGSTGPITLPGVIAQQNAELLAGIILAQLIQPGVPIIYGTTSTNIDMRSGALTIGSPELSLIASAHAQLGRYYHLPTRGGGALTDASIPDSQSGSESMLGLLTALHAGVDFVLHSAGILSSYLAFSYEKMILDDDLCGMIKHLQDGLTVTPETLDYEEITAVGPGGHFLNQPQTVQRCRTEFWQPALADRSGLEAWWSGEQQDALTRARQRRQDLLEEYQPPELDSVVKNQINSYITERKG